MDQNIIYIVVLGFGILLGLAIHYYIIKGKIARLVRSTADLENIRTSLAVSQQQVIMLQENASNLKTELEAVVDAKDSKSSALAKAMAENEALEEKIKNHKGEVESMHLTFSKDFQLLADRIFDEKSEKFTIQNKTSLSSILDPLKEKIADFQKRVDDTHLSHLKETTGLKQELKNLKDLSQKMSDETENLTRALKNDSKIQGNWGEMILENILENSGLKKDREYTVQQSYTTEDGRRFQPDVTIHLPDSKLVIVDSKVSLKAYEQYVGAQEDKELELFTKAHILSLRNHIKGLSEKKYHEIGEGNRLDFVLMFVPIEPAYLLALHRDQSLFNDAYEKGIVMVSPTTLIASLKIIASTWKHEYQNKNALDIASRGKLLYDKFIGFTEDFEKIGDQLTRTGRTYDDALKKLRDGRGSLISQAQQLEELGVKPSKQLSNNLLPDKHD